MTVDVTTQPRTLESYVGGKWVRGSGKGQTLLNAATGAPVARIDSSGVDFAAALACGRESVGPKLRKLSFHERAAMLKALGQFLMAGKEEFYAESLATGATRQPTAGSTSRAAPARCSPTPPRPAVSCRTPASSPTATSRCCRRTRPSPPSTSSPR